MAPRKNVSPPLATVSATSLKRKSSDGHRPELTAAPVVTPVEPPPAPADVVKKIFADDSAVRTIVEENLKERRKTSAVFEHHAAKAFEHFTPSKYAAHVQRRPNYVGSNESVASAQHELIAKRFAAQKDSSSSRSFTLSKSKDLNALIKKSATHSDSMMGTMAVDDLMGYIQQRITGTLTAKDQVYTDCEAEVEADRHLPKDGKAATHHGSATSATTTTDGANGDDPHLTAKKLVRENVESLFSRLTTPEEQLEYETADHPQKSHGHHNVPSFSLRQGASDVTSYHDFHNLLIAFEDVWTELFDQRVKGLGHQMYADYIRLKDFVGAKVDPDLTIKTIDDLKALMQEIRNFSQLVAADHPGSNGIVTFDGNVGVKIQFTSGTPQKDGADTDLDPLGANSRLTKLLTALDKILSEKGYAFDVFAPDSINFGVLVTYRQKWEPVSYQVGDLVSTIPLAPKEVRRYTTKRVAKKSRAVKEVDNSLQVTKTESSDTYRVDAEIVEKTLNKNSFNIMARESIGGGDTIPYTVESTQTSDTQTAQESAQTKKNFRESVIKAAQEYRHEHRMEIDTSESTETEDTTFHEIQNPNDELPVTYLFYELQRTYRISEKLHKLTPVIFVANDVPGPEEITDAWLIEHDWILNHAILDDSFRPALEYLSKSFVGAELNIRILEDNALLQKNLVDRLNIMLKTQEDVLANAQRDVTDKLQSYTQTKENYGFFNTIKGIFDPLGITQKPDQSGAEAAQGLLDYAKDTLDRAEKERKELEAQLQTAITSLQSAVNNLSAAVKEHYDRLAEVDRLRVHVKDNILYYMQAIWSHEPPDQRFFRLYNKDVWDITFDTVNQVARVFQTESGAYGALGGGGEFQAGVTLLDPIAFPTKKLVEIADLDNMLGFKGNYMIFPLKQNTYLTLFMMQDYLEVGDEVLPKDPDELGNYSVDDIEKLAACMFKKSKSVYEKHKDDIKKMIIARLTSSNPESELIIVPTTSLYVEALVGTHTLLEDFKLIHRALDVKKVQAEVRHAELENVRLASRVLKGKDGDPDIERKIIVENAKDIALQPDGN